ncbi:MAG: isochorismatase family protein [Coriobacteriia bacterium]|nr:isochorismatase family protein [Coriobacteriia bacterium]MBN2839560.1 isochorismatase family protein [Coriobacteriia bacterium]
MDPESRKVITADDAVCVLIDVQTSLADVMPTRNQTVAAGRLLLRVADRIGVPVIVTRQNPARLGDTVPELLEVVGPHVPVDKMTFNCLAESAFEVRLEATDRRTVVIAGMETHICVLQTALALLRAGYSVHVVADASCSRRETDRMVALDRLRGAGAIVTTAEQVVYEAVGAAGTPAFRDVLRFVKERDGA